MASGLDMSLDDLIKSNKKSKPSGGRASAPGPARRAPNRSANRPQPYSNIKPVMAPDSTWQHDMHSEQMVTYSSQAPAARASAIETGTKLYISNLDYSVSNEDIKELFSEVGDLKRFSIHYDRSGRSKGSGEVVFSRRNDALAAVKRYNDVQLDGKPMKIEIAGTNIMTPASVPKATNGLLGTHSSIPKSAPVRGTFAGSSRGGGAIGLSQRGANARGRGRGGRGRVRGRSDPVSSEDLDADLEKYHSEAMQISS